MGLLVSLTLVVLSRGSLCPQIEAWRRAFSASQVLLVADPLVLPRTGSQVVVSWPDIERRSGDWLGVFDGATGIRNFTRLDDVELISSQKFTLYNQRRGGYVFRYFRGDNTVVGSSPVVSFAMGDAEPTQLHTALTETGSSLRITWTTNRPDLPVVDVGVQSGTYSLGRSEGTSTTYKSSDFCEPTRIFQHPGYIHTVLVENLRPGLTYYFRYGNDASGQGIAWAPQEAAFTLPPSAGQDELFDVFVVGDMGSSRAYCESCVPDLQADEEYRNQAGDYAPASAAVVDAMAARQARTRHTSFVAHIGDLSYACGVESKWDYWMETIAPIASRVPYMVTMGNHEYGYMTGGDKDPSGARTPFRPSDLYGPDSLGECGVPTARRFTMPANGNSVFWYSFERGLAHFIALSMEHDIRPGSEQHTWLVDDLEAVDRDRTPWVIVLTHRPLYCSEIGAWGDYQNGLFLASHFDSLLLKYKVNLWFGGHYHSYERTCPIYNSTCTGRRLAPLAPVHIMIGTAGIDADHGRWSERIPWTRKHVDPGYGYGVLTVANSSALRWRYVNITLDGVETVMDDVWIGQRIDVPPQGRGHPLRNLGSD